jgi:hypothetical protein
MIPIPFSTGKTILSWFIATLHPPDILTKGNSYCANHLATVFMNLTYKLQTFQVTQ